MLNFVFKTRLIAVFVILSAMSGCSLFSVYKIDIPQGTALTAHQVAKVKVGMSVEQVQYILGSPAVVDGLTPSQWDYMYDYTPGTYGKRAKIPATHKTQKFSVFFDEDGMVAKTTGLASIPERQYAMPSANF